MWNDLTDRTVYQWPEESKTREGCTSPRHRYGNDPTSEEDKQNYGKTDRPFSGNVTLPGPKEITPFSCTTRVNHSISDLHKRLVPKREREQGQAGRVA
jgi:hypothetical protein